MRIRLPFAGAFVFLLLAAAYVGLTSLQVDAYINDKVLHTLTFLVLTICFYWIIDTSRRRTLNFTLILCTAILGVGSEFVQAIIPNGREFDLFDIVANVVGSLGGVGLCSWYHKRMLERKRRAKNYTIVPGDEVQDVELGENVAPQESGVVSSGSGAMTLDEEVDNWDENADEAWDEDEENNAEASKK